MSFQEFGVHPPETSINAGQGENSNFSLFEVEQRMSTDQSGTLQRNYNENFIWAAEETRKKRYNLEKVLEDGEEKVYYVSSTVRFCDDVEME